MTASPSSPSGSAAPRMGVGSVLNRSWATLMRDPVLFFGLSVLATLPALVVDWLSRGGGEEMALTFLFVTLVSMVAAQIIQGAIAYGVYRTLRNEQASIGEAITRGMSRIVPLVIAALLVGLCTGLGMVLLIVPGLILMCMWQVTIPACVVERLGATASMKRSADLTKGYRWTIFGLIILVGILTIGFEMVGGILIGLLGDGNGVGALIAAVARFIPGTFGSVMAATIYYTLREVKEGVSVDNLARVFD